MITPRTPFDNENFTFRSPAYENASGRKWEKVQGLGSCCCCSCCPTCFVIIYVCNNAWRGVGELLNGKTRFIFVRLTSTRFGSRSELLNRFRGVVSDSYWRCRKRNCYGRWGQLHLTAANYGFCLAAMRKDRRDFENFKNEQLGEEDFSLRRFEKRKLCLRRNGRWYNKPKW